MLKFSSIILSAAIIDTANARPKVKEPELCLANCQMDGSEKVCTFQVSRDQYASELGYFKFSGKDDIECEGTNPTLGIEKNVTYFFIQKDVSNYYHALGFAYEADGALDNKPELEPAVFGAEGTSDPGCVSTATCPAPMYFSKKNGVESYLGLYSNNAYLQAITTDVDDFGLDSYEPEFFYPLYDWIAVDEYKVALKYNEPTYSKDIFYFCHIHQFMTGRIKFINNEGLPLQSVDSPEIPYDYEMPSAYDKSCGTSGLEDFQLPNLQCPEKFVCDRPVGPVGEFADCVDTMNCAMIAGMTTNVHQGNAIALFNHQMIPHHQNAVNMCKALLFSGEANCADLSDEEDQVCIINVICQEIINVQNAQIQTMRGVLDSLDYDQEDDCVVKMGKKKKAAKFVKTKKANPSFRMGSLELSPEVVSESSSSSSGSSSLKASKSKVSKKRQ